MVTNHILSRIPRHGLFLHLGFVVMLVFTLCGSQVNTIYAQEYNPNPPTEPVKLIFIHHSCGENWLTDGHGNLGMTLDQNNYFVSDTNYGWGPHSIGDATDIINWPQWFRGPESELYLAALYAENGQLSSYTRSLPDPGGENQVVMFKSCFPNSNLEGNPDDPPANQEGSFTVSNAKYIYNDLLNYFVTRPDKLFVVITAPPVSDPTYAANARGFNTWLVQDWLAENNYSLSNVAVWDFYNILTDANNHHRYENGQVEYITTSGGDTLYYPSGDDHPAPQGNQKATSEYVPMLNTYVNRWLEEAPAAPAPQPEPEQPSEPSEDTPSEPVEEPAPAQPAEVAIVEGVIDNFEAGPPAGSQGWMAYWDQGTETTITCAPDSSMANSGSSSLNIEFNVVPGSWATCALMFDEPQNWSSNQGVGFDLHAIDAALIIDVNAHEGTPGSLATYYYAQETMPESVDGWVRIDLPWSAFNRVDWEPDDGTPLDPAQIMGLTFGFPTYEDAPNTGTIWIDNLELLTSVVGEPEAPAPAPTEAVEGEPPAEAEQQPEAETQPEAEPQAEEEGEQGVGGFLPCSSPIVLGMALAGFVVIRKRHSH
jgi:hypothetical protein